NQNKPSVEAVDLLQLLYNRHSLSLHLLLSEEDDATENLTINDMSMKEGLLNELETILLPYLTARIAALSSSLNLNNFANKDPDLNLTLVLINTSHLDIILSEIMYCIEKVTLGSPLPTESDDHYLNRCKRFRFSLLQTRATILVRENVSLLFQKSSELIQACTTSRDDPANSEHQARICDIKEATLMIVNNSCKLTSSLTNLLQKTDVALVQEEWLATAQSINSVLELLAHINNPSIESNLERDPTHIVDNGKNRKHIVEVGRSFIPFVKLIRLLLYKISTTSENKLPFISNTMNTDKLDRLSRNPKVIIEALTLLMQGLVTLYQTNQPIRDQDQICADFDTITETFHSTSLDICRYLVPLRDPSADLLWENIFGDYFVDLTILWHKALLNFRTIIGGSRPENEEPVE
ncbi:hypothetical protein PTTG_30093, partial [Puccinia triticina 1-1 BBBD Race 1]